MPAAMFDLHRLVRPHLLDLKPYSSARDEYTGHSGIFLDANENALGSVGVQTVSNRYPDPYQREVRAELARIREVGPENIFLGHGSDEAIDLIIRLFCEPGKDSIAHTPPTYGMYAVSAAINAVKVVEVPLTPQFQLDTDLLLRKAAKTKVIFLCSPNNPTGNLLRREDIEKVLREFGGIVVVDEAYIDFADDPGFVKRLAEFPNLIVLQTFSKAWGLAAIRLGMAYASPEIIRLLQKIKPPYNVSQSTQTAALEALRFVRIKDKMVTSLNEERRRLAQALAKLPFVQQVYPSDANFLLVCMDDPEAVYQYLIHLPQPIIVRDRSKVIRCGGCLRITVGKESENAQLTEALKRYRPETVGHESL